MRVQEAVGAQVPSSSVLDGVAVCTNVLRWGLPDEEHGCAEQGASRAF
jgi:hypothetical protein